MNSTITLSPPKRGQQRTPAAAESRVLRIRNILVTTDFSRASDRAIKAVAPLIKSFGAELHFVHVLPPDRPFPVWADMPIVFSGVEVQGRLRARLQETATKLSLPLRPKNVHLLEGRPFEQICQLARDSKIDLIVIATRGQAGLKHLLLGSTAERVVRYSPCPVLVVRPGRVSRNGAGTSIHFRKLLVPIDFSKCSLRGLDYARALSSKLGSKLILMHSICPGYYPTNDEYARYDFPELLRKCETAARKELSKLIGHAQDSKLEADVPSTFGHAGLQICSRAKQLGVDLIVTSTHGRSGFKHALIGSTAEYVVRHADCPVLVVPSHERPNIKSRGGKS